MASNFAFTPAELRKLRSLKGPDGIQRFLDALPYHLADTAWSPRRVLRESTAHCLEGAIFAAAALRVNGYSPLLLDFEAEHDTDHVMAIYQVKGHWGAVAKSNYSGLRYREPVYRNLRELAISYFEDYFNLERFDKQQWMTTEKPVWFIVYHLFEVRHYKLLTRAMINRLHRVDERTFQAEILGKRWKPVKGDFR